MGKQKTEIGMGEFTEDREGTQRRGDFGRMIYSRMIFGENPEIRKSEMILSKEEIILSPMILT